MPKLGTWQPVPAPALNCSFHARRGQEVEALELDGCRALDPYPTCVLCLPHFATKALGLRGSYTRVLVCFLDGDLS